MFSIEVKRVEVAVYIAMSNTAEGKQSFTLRGNEILRL